MADLDILIPHYNDPEGLALSLKSIAGQTGWEGRYRVVVADDGSRPDDKAAVEQLCAETDMRIDLLHIPDNRGRPYTRNVLLDAMDSPYVAWLDAGDEWYPKKLSAQFAAVRDIELAGGGNPYWVTCHYDWSWGEEKKKKTHQNTEQDQIRGLLTGRLLRAYLWTLVGPAHAFRTVGWFDERLPRLQDLDYFIRFLLHGGYIHSPQTDEALCVYNKSYIGRGAEEVNACSLLIFDKHRVLYNRYGWKFCRMRRFEMERLAARFAFHNGEEKKKRRFFMNAFKIHPLAFVWRLLKQGSIL